MATYFVDGDVGSDANAGTSAGAGNAWLTVSKALASVGDGDIAYVKQRAASAVYSIATGLTAGAGTGGVSYGSKTRLIGYGVTTGDGLRPTIQASAAIVGLTISGTGWSIENFVLDGNATGTQGVAITGLYDNAVVNCVLKNWTAEGFKTSASNCKLIRSEVTGCAGTNAAVDTGGSAVLIAGCAIHANTKAGVYNVGSGVPAAIVDCLIANNSGATSDGILLSSYPNFVRGCTIYGNGRDGIRLSGFHIILSISNNILESNGGYGINSPTMSPGAVDLAVDFNAFYNNTSGARNIVQAAPGDVTLTGSAFTNAAGGDFTLNATAGAGAACRAAGFPGALIYGGTGYRDLGALQHQDSGGGSTTYVLNQVINRILVNEGDA